jgi:hypothetical protein
MCLPTRIVLSRKGFDKDAGGYASPILSCDNTMFSIPIPDDAEGGGITYEKFGSQGIRRLPSALQRPMGTVIDLTANRFHLDPDIRPDLRGPGRAGKRMFFGQQSRAQTILQNAGVTVNDLFLFFGWFRTQASYEPDNRIRFERGGKDLHSIWGWLQIGEIVPLERNAPVPESLSDVVHHPHVAARNRSNNCIYIARSNLTFNSSIPGAGIFPFAHDDLRLTDPGQPNRSHWLLPAFFSRVDLGGHARRPCEPCSDGFRVKSARRGQEFVFCTNRVESEAHEWLRLIFRHAAVGC